MASRRKSRILAFQALYFWEASREPPASPDGKDFRIPVEELITFSWLGDEKLLKLDESMAVFSKALILGTIENIDDVDGMIKNHLENWDISRVNRVDLAVLRISVYTLMFQNDIPPTIVINEAIGICMEYGTDDSYKFINGVLDSIRRKLVSQ